MQFVSALPSHTVDAQQQLFDIFGLRLRQRFLILSVRLNVTGDVLGRNAVLPLHLPRREPFGSHLFGQLQRADANAEDFNARGQRLHFLVFLHILQAVLDPVLHRAYRFRTGFFQ